MRSIDERLLRDKRRADLLRNTAGFVILDVRASHIIKKFCFTRINVTKFANQERIDGVEKLAAIKNGAIARLRPVLMTTGATVLGHFPLVLVTGAGAEARNSIGAVLVFGMLIGTLFTLVILPAVYAVLASNRDMTKDAKSSEIEASLDNEAAIA